MPFRVRVANQRRWKRCEHRHALCMHKQDRRARNAPKLQVLLNRPQARFLRRHTQQTTAHSTDNGTGNAFFSFCHRAHTHTGNHSQESVPGRNFFPPPTRHWAVRETRNVCAEICGGQDESGRCSPQKPAWELLQMHTCHKLVASW